MAKSPRHSGHYDQDGFRPTYVGETLKKRYVLLMTIGNGSYGCVYLSWDLKGTKHKFVVVKISRCSEVFYRVTKKESKRLAKISRETNRVAKYLDSFDVKGYRPDRLHHCLVTEALGLSLFEKLTKRKKPFELHTVIDIGIEIIRTLRDLHKNGMYHYDLKPENIVLGVKKSELCTNVLRFLGKMRKRERLDRNEIPWNYKVLEVEERERWKKFYADHKEHRAMLHRVSVEIREYKEELYHKREQASSTLTLKLCDFGSSRPTDCTTGYYAPETYFTEHYIWKKSAPDVWSFGCLLFEVATNSLLFFTHQRRDFSEEERRLEHLRYIAAVATNFKKRIFPQGATYNAVFTESGGFVGRSSYAPQPPALNLLQKFKWKWSQAQQFGAFLESILIVDPRKRPTAEECLHRLKKLREDMCGYSNQYDTSYDFNSVGLVKPKHIQGVDDLDDSSTSESESEEEESDECLESEDVSSDDEEEDAGSEEEESEESDDEEEYLQETQRAVKAPLKSYKKRSTRYFATMQARRSTYKEPEVDSEEDEDEESSDEESSNEESSDEALVSASEHRPNDDDSDLPEVSQEAEMEGLQPTIRDEKVHTHRQKNPISDSPCGRQEVLKVIEGIRIQKVRDDEERVQKTKINENDERKRKSRQIPRKGDIDPVRKVFVREALQEKRSHKQYVRKERKDTVKHAELKRTQERAIRDLSERSQNIAQEPKRNNLQQNSRQGEDPEAAEPRKNETDQLKRNGHGRQPMKAEEVRVGKRNVDDLQFTEPIPKRKRGCPRKTPPQGAVEVYKRPVEYESSPDPSSPEF
ncbi:hypothetical protein QR680_002916 [Steinernema hermaphroditum]|uniref:Protein kinase domain-containing protein n=1 Tax=Steinernema hermaphroditum TaxID=289476 RepID=A0AA39H5H1_9BILA|nr:hypothetical protein QR680_002916 [Steinernema hermaphroditum]